MASHDQGNSRLLRCRQGLRAMDDWGYGRCFLIYVFAFAILFASVFFGGQVVTPVRQGDFFAQSKTTLTDRLENPKFGDYVLYAVPEAEVFLHGKRSGWIATWDPFNELGRPTSHLSGLSPAYFPNWVLSRFTDDAFTYLSAIVWLQMFAAGTFAFLFARELQWRPYAALVAALALGVSPSLIYWATFPMFAAAYGWTMATLYAFLRWLRQGDLLAWSLLAFAVYSLLLTAYPVMVVYYAYLIAGFFVYRVLKHSSFPCPRWSLHVSLAGGAAAMLFGVLAALPALADTFITTLQSSRVHPDVDFFRAAILPLETPADWQRFFAFWTFPQILGDPISVDYPVQFNGRSLAPFVVFLLCLAGWRRVWGWWLALGVLIVTEAFPPVFAFAVTHLGLGMSRSVPSVLAVVPLVVIAAFGMDALSRKTAEVPRHWAVWLLPAGLYLMLLGNACMAASGLHQGVRWQAVLILAAYLPVLLCAVRYRWPLLVIVVAVAHLCIFDRQLLLTQPRQSIVQNSAATESLGASLANGGRFAVNASAEDFLRPNLNTQAMLPSVHSYDSLSPLRYRALIPRLGGEVTTYGRNNLSIDEKSVESIDFKLADIASVVSRHPIASTMLTESAEVAGLHIYRVSNRSGRFTFFDVQPPQPLPSSLQVNQATPVQAHTVVNMTDDGDRIVVKFADHTRQAMTMVAGQMFNPGWRAEGHADDGWHRLSTLPVNDAFEGIVVPAGMDAVRLSFRPWVRLSWLGHVGFGLMILLLVLFWTRNRIRAITVTPTGSVAV